MDATAPARTHRTFARPNGLNSAGVPHLVAAEERHRKNVQHIQQLKAALCSTVSSSLSSKPFTPLSRGASLVSSSASPSSSSATQSAWGGAGFRDRSSGAVTTTPAAPSPPLRNPLPPAAALQHSQDEVEKLVREKHQLQRQCIELAALLHSPPRDAPDSSAGALVTAPAPAGHEAEVVAWSPVHDAALAVVEQVTRCYPGVVRDWDIVKSGLDSSRGHGGAGSAGASARHGLPGRDTRCEGSMYTDVSDITADELADALHRLAAFLPQLASMTAVSELVAEAGPDMLDHIHILEEEKRSDCLSVLAITDHLTRVAAQLRREAAEKDAAVHSLHRTVEQLMAEKQDWARRARASEEALAERYTQYRQREKTWEREVAALLQSKSAAAAAVTAEELLSAQRSGDSSSGAEERAAEAAQFTAAQEALRGELETVRAQLGERDAALAELEAERDAVRDAHAALQASSDETAAAQAARIAQLTSRLGPLEAELQAQAGTIESTLQRVAELTAAHQEETRQLTTAHGAALSEREAALNGLRREKAGVEEELRVAAAARDAAQAALAEQSQLRVEDSSSFLASATTPRRLLDGRQHPAASAEDADLEEGEGDAATAECSLQVGEGDNDESGDSLSRCTNVRKLQQSVKRMSRERAALKRKLEHRGAALSEVEAELEAAQHAAAQREARLQVLTADLERLTRESAAAEAEVAAAPLLSSAAHAAVPICWIDFAELESHQSEGTLYPAPVDLSAWLLSREEPARLADYVARCLSPGDRLLVDAVGPLYHVGYTLLKVEGLLSDDATLPLIWRRFLFQLQQVLDGQLQGQTVSPSDSAKCFYALASTAGLWRAGGAAPSLRSEPAAPLAAYTRILAALCVCLPTHGTPERPAVGGERGSQEEEGESSDTRSGSSASAALSSHHAKAHHCRAILQHVLQQCDGGTAGGSTSGVQAGKDAEEAERNATAYGLFTALMQQSAWGLLDTEAAVRGSEVQQQQEQQPLTTSVSAVAASAASDDVSPSSFDVSLPSLLSSALLSDVPALMQMVLLEMSLQPPQTDREDEGEKDSRAEYTTVTVQRSPLTPPPPTLAGGTPQHRLASLLLCVARYESVWGGLGGEEEEEHRDTSSSAGAPGKALPSLESVGVRCGLLSSRLSETPPPPNTIDALTEVLLLMETTLLPAVALSVRLCPALDHEQQLLSRYFPARAVLTGKLEALRSHADGRSAGQPAGTLPGVTLLGESSVRDWLLRMESPAPFPALLPGRVVQMPLAEYERLHRELLLLYQANEKSEAYIEELLGAVEAM